MDTQQLNQIAESLRESRAKKIPISAPSKTYTALDVNGAFEVQKIGVQNAVQGGDRVVGFKLGNIAKVMQDAFGLDHPDYGYLLSSTFVYEGTKVLLKDFIKPYVELEPAFVLKGPLRGPNVTVIDVINAIDYALPAVEIIDSRVKDWDITLEDTLADNGSTGAVILGGTPRKITDLSLSDMHGSLQFNGSEIMAGNTRNVLGNPLSAVAWLVNKLATYDIGLEAGHIILPGSCLRAMPMEGNGHWACTFQGWGSVEFDAV